MTGMMTPSDEAYWSLAVVGAVVLWLACWAVLDHARRHQWSQRAQAWLDALYGQEHQPSHLRASEPTLATDAGVLAALPGHVRVLEPGDVPLWHKPITFEVQFDIGTVDRQFIDMLYGGREWRPYDWQIDGDAWPTHT